MALKRNCKTLAKVRDDEEIFVLRAQDNTTPKMIILWIAENMHAPDEKLREAFECALRARREKKSKASD